MVPSQYQPRNGCFVQCRGWGPNLIETDGPSPRFTLGGSDPPRERGNPDADAAELALRTAAGLRRGVERLLVQETDRRRGPVGRPRYWYLSPPFHRCDTLSRANLCLPVRPALGSPDPEGGNRITGMFT